MAPPSNRRTGFSRRAQYSTFFAYLAAGLGALIGGAMRGILP
jgi:rod shape-determining protein MreC